MRLLLSTLLLSATLALPRVAAAEEAVPAGAQLEPAKPDPRVTMPNHKLRHAIGLGLMISAGVMALVGAGLVGGAAQANKDVFAGDVYHPDKADLRDHLETADAILFSAAAVTFVPGLVLFCDR